MPQKEVVYKTFENLKPIFSGGGLTPPKFTPTFYEWIVSKGTEIIRVTSTPVGMYEVPEGYYLFMTDFSVSASYKTAPDDVGLAVQDRWIVGIRTNTNTSTTVTHSYIHPMRFYPNENIAPIFSAVSSEVIMYFRGFLVKITDIPDL